MENIYEQIRKLSFKYENETADFLAKMIQTPSFSMKEKEMVAVIKNEMEKIGFDKIRIDDLGSIIGKIGNGKQIIAFDAHIDTVYPGNLENWNFPPHAGIIKNGKVWGRGASDQLGGMASMVYAAKIIKELDLNNDFTILFTGTVMEEDCDGIAWKHLIAEDNIRPEIVVSTEPTSLNIYRGHRGRMEISVEVKGVSCHGSAPERGENAIYKMARIALEIEKLNDHLKHDDFLGKGTITTTIFESDSPSQCAVADFARIHIDRRLTFGETKVSALSEIEECCRKARISNATIKVLQYNEKAYTGKSYPVEKYFPTWKLEKNSKWLKNAEISYNNIFNKKPKIDKWTFSTNCVFIMGEHAEIKCIGMGPGDENQAHAPNEMTRISDLSAAAAFYAAFVAQLNNK
ncbi:MAG: YgeY family selenium metabolism-linked hydrolase [Candidatus Cloacimonetes bacterium]|jgi:putative selenium metabolism hydrolase|nr:YgeY family selenium metabolism-linked hydrolase [Candidatus Cloacimonadota bacterium]MBT6993991.1 YgeY family selenium metabolism-linked hydrolase [Candidatus Cloacimonadota bacterium]MBT7468869.1 YgeY family selenium metabolism-linked hydrolase [Candidatus Cloacimonadota bacterium]